MTIITANHAWMLGIIGMAGLLWHVYFEHMERDAWDIYHDQCMIQYLKNGNLLKLQVCDKGENELAHQDKVDCGKARDENALGPRWCATRLWAKNHPIYVIICHLWHSWWVYLAFLVGIVVWIRGYWNSSTETSKHQITVTAFQKTALEYANSIQPYQQQYPIQRIRRDSSSSQEIDLINGIYPSGINDCL